MAAPLFGFDLALQLFQLDFVLTLLFLQAVDTIGRLVDDLLQDLLRARIFAGDRTHFDGMEFDAPFGIKVGVIAKDGAMNDLVEASQKLFQRHFGDRL